MATTRKLKLFNGRAYCCRKRTDPFWEDIRTNQGVYAYIAAYSRADAARVIEEYCGRRPPDSELKNYFSECWGNAMDDITPVRGLWLQVRSPVSPPVKVL